MAAAEKVKSIIAEQLGIKAEEVTPEASFIDDLGADSLDTVELVIQAAADLLLHRLVELDWLHGIGEQQFLRFEIAPIAEPDQEIENDRPFVGIEFADFVQLYSGINDVGLIHEPVVHVENLALLQFLDVVAAHSGFDRLQLGQRGYHADAVVLSH